MGRKNEGGEQGESEDEDEYEAAKMFFQGVFQVNSVGWDRRVANLTVGLGFLNILDVVEVSTWSAFYSANQVRHSKKFG